MNDEQLRAAYERALPSGDDRRPLGDIEAEQIRRLVDREGEEGDRLHTLDTLLSTAEGRRELEIVWSASRAARPRPAFMPWWKAAAAVALLAGAGTTWSVLRRQPADVVRDIPTGLHLVAPRGSVPEGDARRFSWKTFPGTERYTLVVVDTAGNAVYTAQAADTTVTLPDSVAMTPGRTFMWWVTSRTSSGEENIAQPTRVTITPR